MQQDLIGQGMAIDENAQLKKGEDKEREALENAG